MILSVEMPDSISRQLQLDGSEGGRRALEMLALEGYRDGNLSRGQISDLLSMKPKLSYVPITLVRGS